MQYASGGRLTDFCSKKSLLFSVLLLRLYTFSNTFECPLPYILKNLFIHLHLLRYIMEICQFGEELSASIEVLHYSCCINLNLLISLSATKCESGAKSKKNIYIHIHIYIFIDTENIAKTKTLQLLPPLLLAVIIIANLSPGAPHAVSFFIVFVVVAVVFCLNIHGGFRVF